MQTVGLGTCSVVIMSPWVSLYPDLSDGRRGSKFFVPEAFVHCVLAGVAVAF